MILLDKKKIENCLFSEYFYSIQRDAKTNMRWKTIHSIWITFLTLPIAVQSLPIVHTVFDCPCFFCKIETKLIGNWSNHELKYQKNPEKEEEEEEKNRYKELIFHFVILPLPAKLHEHKRWQILIFISSFSAFNVKEIEIIMPKW